MPIVEYNNYQLEEYMLGLGMNHFININSELQFYSGLQVLIPFQSEFNYRMTYFDDYYIYKDIKGVDLPEEEVFDLENHLRFNLMLGIRARLY